MIGTSHLPDIDMIPTAALLEFPLPSDEAASGDAAAAAMTSPRSSGDAGNQAAQTSGLRCDLRRLSQTLDARQIGPMV